MLNKQVKPIIGDCEIKDGHTNVEVWLTQPGNIYMCAACMAEQQVLTQRNEAAQNLINSFKSHDSVMEVKTEIWNAQQIPLMELKAAIQQNDEIPESEKSHAFIKECKSHVEKLDSLIFQMRKQLNDMDNERAAWQTNGQEAYGKLRSELRDGFRQFDLNYKPATVKEIKPKAVKTPAMSAKQKAQLAIEAGKKYGVPGAGVQMIAEAQKISYEAAAIFLQKQLTKREELAKLNSAE